MRYVFMMLLVILGSEGIRQTFRLVSSRQRSSGKEAAAASAIWLCEQKPDLLNTGRYE
jgi:hypothetical protein